MIELRDVGLSFNGHRVLEALHFRAHYHERVAILGRSGSGKTTVLRLLLGLVRPDSGEIMVDGGDITHLSEQELRPIRMNFSIVFQEGALFDSLSVRENVAFCLREFTDLTEAEIERRVREILNTLEIEEAIDLMPEELSGGMQKRVAIARSLAHCEPRMFLYDEPTTGLDPITAENVMRLIMELSRGEIPDRKGFIVVTHRVAHAVKIAERFVFLKDKKIAFDGNLEELRGTTDPELQLFVQELS